MEVDKQLKFKSHQRMQVEFISNNVDMMTHDCLSSVALALGIVIPNARATLDKQSCVITSTLFEIALQLYKDFSAINDT